MNSGLTDCEEARTYRCTSIVRALVTVDDGHRRAAESHLLQCGRSPGGSEEAHREAGYRLSGQAQEGVDAVGTNSVGEVEGIQGKRYQTFRVGT